MLYTASSHALSVCGRNMVRGVHVALHTLIASHTYRHRSAIDYLYIWDVRHTASQPASQIATTHGACTFFRHIDIVVDDTSISFFLLLHHLFFFPFILQSHFATQFLQTIFVYVISIFFYCTLYLHNEFVPSIGKIRTKTKKQKKKKQQTKRKSE